MTIDLSQLKEIFPLASAAISPFLLAYIAYITTRKNQLEQQLNDKKRETYQGFIDALEHALRSSQKPIKNTKELENKVFEFKKKLILFADARSIQASNKWLRENSAEDHEKNFENIENLIKSLRREIGLSNGGLKKFDILQVFIKEDIKKGLQK